MNEDLTRRETCEDRLDGLLAAYLAALEAGRPLNREALLREHPDLAEELAEFFAGFDEVEQLLLPLRTGNSGASSAVSTVIDPNRTTPAEQALQGAPPTIAVREVPGYEILGVLGRGAMGVVYRAHQVGLKRVVALKMILAGDDADPAERARFLREAEAVARLTHPNIVQIHEVGEHGGLPYFSLELVSGGTLAARLAGRPQPPREAAATVRTLALAMEAAHQRDIIHRDLKPSNILLNEDGTPKISDFGLAKRLDEDSGQTRTGAVLGTPTYMAPEQAAGEKDIGPAADVYALGAILYAMLTGGPPFRGATVQQTLEQVRTREPDPVRRRQPGVPLDLETICLKCLEKEPRRRYASARELADRLQLFLDGQPIPDRPRGWLSKSWRAVRRHPFWSAAVVLLALAPLVGLVAAHYTDPERDRKDLKRTLQRGKAYRFAGGEALPGPFRQVYGPPAPLTPVPGEDAFSIDTSEAVLWELTDDPMEDSYTFSAEVRHDGSGNANSQVGIYFGYREGPAVEGRRRGGFYTLTFGDRGGLVTQRPGGDPKSSVLLEKRLFEEREFSYVPFGPMASRPFVPALAPGRMGPWRRLQVVVTPEGIEAYWEPVAGQGEVIRRLTGPQVSRSLQLLEVSVAELNNVPTDYRSRAGLGLFVLRGKASFRNVLVKLPESG